MGNRILKYILYMIICSAFFIISIKVFVEHNKISFEDYKYVRIIYQYGDINLNYEIKNTNDISVIKDSLAGKTNKDLPSCGFSSNIAIVLYDESKSIKLCLAQDNCPKLRINETDTYIKISDSQRKNLNCILEKYGMKFPCV